MSNTYTSVKLPDTTLSRDMQISGHDTFDLEMPNCGSEVDGICDVACACVLRLEKMCCSLLDKFSLTHSSFFLPPCPLIFIVLINVRMFNYEELILTRTQSNSRDMIVLALRKEAHRLRRARLLRLDISE